MQSGQSIGSANSASANLRPPRKGSVSVEYKLAQKSIQANAVPTVSTVHNWPAFAAGGVWTESVMDSLCVQVIFTLYSINAECVGRFVALEKFFLHV